MFIGIQKAVIFTN